jgi:hypothetical protein
MASFSSRPMASRVVHVADDLLESRGDESLEGVCPGPKVAELERLDASQQQLRLVGWCVLE